MSVILFAQHYAPSGALSKLEAKLKAKGIEVSVFLGGGKPVNLETDDLHLIKQAKAILIGMSSYPDSVKEVQLARFAYHSGIPYGFYADTYDCHARIEYQDVRENTSFLFVINGEEAAKAKELFPDAEIVVSGNPLWEEFTFPRFTKQEVRNRLGIADEEIILLSSSGNDSGFIQDVLLLGGLVETLRLLDLRQKKPPRVIFSLHPGNSKKPEAYDGIVKYSKVPIQVVPFQTIKGAEMVPGADILVLSMSTLGAGGAHQRKPVINYLTEIALSELEVSQHHRRWEPVVKGIEEAVYGNPEELAKAIIRLLTPEGFAPMRKRQEIVYPKPQAQGEAVRIMAETIAELLKK